MKNKKGFTIVELVCVITLLAIIMLVAFPNFASLTNTVKNNYDNSTKILIKSAASMYVNNNRDEIDTALSSSNSVCIPIGKLIAYEYLDDDIKDKDGNPLSVKQCVDVTKTTTSGKVKYNYNIGNTSIGDNIDYLPPVLYVKKLPNASNPSIICKPTTIASSWQDFKSNCGVFSKDGDSTEVNITGELNDGPTAKCTKRVEENSITLTCNDQDSSGNKSLPLKVYIKIE